MHPASRRGGLGRALLRHAAMRAADHGRSVLRGEVLQGTAGAAFAARVGATAGLVDARRVLALGEIPAGHIAALREQAARAAAGYSLVSWEGRTPDQYLAGFAEVLNAANDMPHDPGEERGLGRRPGPRVRRGRGSGAAGTCTRSPRCTPRAARWRR